MPVGMPCASIAFFRLMVVAFHLILANMQLKRSRQWHVFGFMPFDVIKRLVSLSKTGRFRLQNGPFWGLKSNILQSLGFQVVTSNGANRAF